MNLYLINILLSHHRYLPRKSHCRQLHCTEFDSEPLKEENKIKKNTNSRYRTTLCQLVKSVRWSSGIVGTGTVSSSNTTIRNAVALLVSISAQSKAWNERGRTTRLPVQTQTQHYCPQQPQGFRRAGAPRHPWYNKCQN